MFKRVHDGLAHTIATGFGFGLAPKAPGTFGTLVGIPIYLLVAEWSVLSFGLLVLTLFVLGVWASEVRGRALNESDHGSIVWDEVVGYLITMMVAPAATIFWIVLGFVFFRLFDIWKPWPIRWFDNSIKSGFGTMLDDVVAGLYAALALWLVTFLV